MKVLIITKESFPNGMAATSRVTCYAKGLLSSGVSCEVLIATRTEKYGDVSKNNKPIGSYYKYISGKTLRESNFFLRKINDILDKYKTITYIKTNTTSKDIILNYLREDRLNEAIIKAAKKTGAKVLRDLCEYPLGTGEENNYLKRKRMKYLSKVFPKFDGFICISQSLADLANLYKSPEAKLVKIPIMVDVDSKEKGDFDSCPKLPYIFHSGTLLNQKDGILGAIEAFGIASKQLDFKFNYVLTGDLEKSPHSKEIMKLINKYEIKNNVIFTGFLSKKKLDLYLNGSSLMIINKLDNQQNNYCFATKLGEYLLSGKPVITTSIGEASNYLMDNVSAYIVEPGNIQLLSDKIISVLNDQEQSSIVGENGRNVALKDFSYNYQGKRLVKFLKLLQDEF